MTKKKVPKKVRQQFNIDVPRWLREAFDQATDVFLEQTHGESPRPEVLRGLLLHWVQSSYAQRLSIVQGYWEERARRLARHSAPLGPEDAQQVVRKAQAKTGFRGGRTRPG